ncbi:MAG: hypothetical protein JKY80_09165 [Mariprofundaceae bacterium]|nr:hypothetical protein [Mariprofundaceae bacterium]
MATYEMNDKELLNNRRQERALSSFHFSHPFIVFAVTVLLTSCGHLHFSKSGLWESGQQWAHDNCTKYRHSKDYQECIIRVDESYGENYK